MNRKILTENFLCLKYCVPLLVITLLLLFPDRLSGQSTETLITEGNSWTTAKKYGKALACYSDALLLSMDNTLAKKKIEQINTLLNKNEEIRNSLFEENITSATEFLGNGQQKEALLAFKAASQLRTDSRYPTDKIKEITKTFPDPVIEKGYLTAIERGKKALNDGHPEEAKKAFKHALLIKPLEAYPTQQLEAIEAVIEQSDDLRNRYDETIQQADEFLSAGDDQQALEKYNAALELIPSSPYPAQQIALLKEKINKNQAIDTQYQQKITEADNLYRAKKYEEAKTNYNKAKQIKPSENYPQSMIARIEEALLAQKSEQQQYRQLIKDADIENASGNITEAINKYKQAAALLPDESYPTDKIKEIETRLALEKETKEQFDEALAKGDKAYAVKSFDEALAQYTTALAFQPNNKYAQDKIAEINGLLAENEAKENAYQEILSEAKRLVDQEEYATALGKFRTASQLRPEDALPKAKISELEKIIEKSEKDKNAYDKLIADADKNYRTQVYDLALAGYQQASLLLPQETYPEAQIQNIYKKKNDARALLEAQFNELINKAENEAEKEQYGTAIALYTEAFQLMPEKTEIEAQIQELSQQMEAAGQRDEAYNKVVARADTYMQRKQYEEAAATYKEALIIKPGAPYATEKNTEIEKILAARETEKRNTFDNLIKQGDISHSKNDYAKALHAYTEAAELYHDDPYAIEKIAALKAVIDETDALEADYLKVITRADQWFNENKLPEAQKEYQQASDIKPGETYPKQRIIEINQRLAEQQTINNEYNTFIKKADQYYAELQFDQATEWYAKAQKVKPQEAYPANQIIEITALKKDIAGRTRAYEEKIIEADRYYSSQNLEKSRALYIEAKNLKPNETYPDEQLVLIDEALKDLQTENEAFDALQQTAETLYNAANYKEALEAFRQALAIKPDDENTKRRMNSTEHLLSETKSKSETYKDLIERADRAFTDNEFTQAKNLYEKALGLFPDKAYAKSKLSEAEAHIALFEQQRQIEYDKTIETADRLFAMGQYSGALENYRTAHSIRSDDVYPSEKIKETEAIIRKQKAAQMNEYLKLVAQADASYQGKQYANAIENYEKAGKLNTGEQYPYQMISNIKEVIARQVAVDIPIKKNQINEKGKTTLSFAPLHYSQKRNNYLILIARNSGELTPKVFLSFGEGKQKNGGVVIPNIESTEAQEYIIPLNTMDRWYRQNNNWIEIYCASGSVEVMSIRISNIVE
ncbi:MAG: hypothetical protein PHT77_09940 [Bacteroidales bacterium]|nr:hypothetical protein [Bacteroidales bacterium]MDD3962170.1 hypothetical protein [Bacteroidales bacterium]